MGAVAPLDQFLIPLEELECIYYDLSGGKGYDEDGEVEGWLGDNGIRSFSELVVKLDGFVPDLMPVAFMAGVADDLGLNPFASWYGCPGAVREFVSEVVCFKCYVSIPIHIHQIQG